MANYKDNPPLKKLTHDDCKEALKQSYKIVNKEEIIEDYTLQIKILNDFRNDKFITNISNIIIDVIKKDDKHMQAVYNTDINRLSYFIKKTIDHWIIDKAGINFNKLVIEPILNTILSLINEYYNYLMNYNEKLCDKQEKYRLANNKKKLNKIYEEIEKTNNEIFTAREVKSECKTVKSINYISKKVSPHLQFIKEDHQIHNNIVNDNDNDNISDNEEVNNIIGHNIIVIFNEDHKDKDKILNLINKCNNNNITIKLE